MPTGLLDVLPERKAKPLLELQPLLMCSLRTCSLLTRSLLIGALV